MPKGPINYPNRFELLLNDSQVAKIKMLAVRHGSIAALIRHLIDNA